MFLLRTIVIVIVVIARFLYCTFIIYSSIRLSSRKCVINSAFSVQYCVMTVASSEKNSFHMVQSMIGCTPNDKQLSYASYMQTAVLSAVKNR